MTPNTPSSTEPSAEFKSQKTNSGSKEHSRIVRPYHRPDANTQPPYLYPPYRSTTLRSPRKPLILFPNTLSEVTGPVFGHDDIAENDNDLTRHHKGEPIGQRISVSGRVLDDNGRPVANTLDRNLADQRWRSLRSRRRSTSRRFGSEFHRLWPRAYRCRGKLSLRDHQAGSLSVAKSPQRLASRAYPFFAVRHSFYATPGDANVFPGRPAVSIRSHLQLDSRRARPKAFDFEIRTRIDRAGMVPRISLGYCAARAGRNSL